MKKFKKFVIILGALLIVALPFCGNISAYADGPEVIVEDTTFFGLKPWYSGLRDKNTNELVCVQDVPDSGSNCLSLTTFIWTAVANVATDLAVIAAFGAIGFMLYGGYLYMFSNGEAAKVSAGKKTITNSIIGLAVAMLANVIFTTIKTVLLVDGYSVGVEAGGAQHNLVNIPDPGLVATETVQWVVGVAGVVCLIFIILGGVSYTTSNGDAAKVKKAKDTILYALIGLAIVGLAEVITAFAANMIRDSKKDTVSTILIKEANEEQIS